MTDRTPILQYETITFTGVETQIFTVPANVVSLAFQVTAGAVVRRNTADPFMDGWTVANGLPQGFDMRSLEGEVMYFRSAGNATMEICWVTGLAS